MRRVGFAKSNFWIEKHCCSTSGVIRRVTRFADVLPVSVRRSLSQFSLSLHKHAAVRIVLFYVIIYELFFMI